MVWTPEMSNNRQSRKMPDWNVEVREVQNQWNDA